MRHPAASQFILLEGFTTTTEHGILDAEWVSLIRAPLVPSTNGASRSISPLESRHAALYTERYRKAVVTITGALSAEGSVPIRGAGSLFRT
jgi:hypothetical protein